jgi:hypothetical protein
VTTPIRALKVEVQGLRKAFLITEEEILDGLAVEIFRRRLKELWPDKRQLTQDECAHLKWRDDAPLA